MEAARKIRPSAALDAIKAPLATPGAPTPQEVELRAGFARMFDPARPGANKTIRVAAVEWLKANGVDLAALGLPAHPDDDPASAPAESVAAEGPTVKFPGVDSNAADGPGPTATKNAPAERALLGAWLTDNSTIAATIEVTRPQDFAYPQHRVVARAVLDLHTRGARVTAGTVVHELRGTARLDLAGGADAIEALTGGADVAAASDHAACIRETAEARAARKAVKALHEGLALGNVRASEAVASVRQLLDRLDADNTERGVEAEGKHWPAPPDDDAWQGVAGEIVAAVSPHTEADPVSLLAQLLVCFGSVAGRNAFWQVNATRHYTNLNAVIVGPSGLGLKGTSWDIVDAILGRIDSNWRENCVHRGLTTGEGMIELVRDPSRTFEGSDAGVSDKRCLWIETEFSRVIAAGGRDKSILGEVICQAFDSHPLRSASRANPVRCEKPHVSVVAHTTITLIRRVLGESLKNSGFGNRFMWLCARRSRELPFGGDVLKAVPKECSLRLCRAITHASTPALGKKPIGMTKPAEELYVSIYGALTAPRTGAAAPLLHRAAPIVRRLALIYALLDLKTEVGVDHLRAGLALWRYCERSAQFLFGDPEADAGLARALDAIRESMPEGIGKAALNRDLRLPAQETDRVLARLAEEGLVEARELKTGGRPVTRYFLTHASGARAKCEKPPVSS